MTNNLVIQVPFEVISVMESRFAYEKEGHLSYQVIINDFQAFFKRAFGQKVSLYLLGSRVMELATEESCLDMFLCFGKANKAVKKFFSDNLDFHIFIIKIVIFHLYNFS